MSVQLNTEIKKAGLMKGSKYGVCFGKSLFGRKLHYAGRLMFDKSRQGAHIAFNISNIEN